MLMHLSRKNLLMRKSYQKTNIESNFPINNLSYIMIVLEMQLQNKIWLRMNNKPMHKWQGIYRNLN